MTLVEETERLKRVQEKLMTANKKMDAQRQGFRDELHVVIALIRGHLEGKQPYTDNLHAFLDRYEEKPL